MNACGRSSSVEHQLPKLDRRVQFPSPAYIKMQKAYSVERIAYRKDKKNFLLYTMHYTLNTELFCIVILPFVFCVLNLIGCATIDNNIPKSSGSVLPSRRPAISGIYHRLERGQTLWRISRLYTIDIDEILSINNIDDSTRINAGQLIFIPNRSTKAYSNNTEGTFHDFIWPVKGKIVSGYGEKSANLINKGITMKIPLNSDIVASNSGTVVFVNEMLRGYGKTVIISHNSGIMTVYSLLSKILVKPGEYINKGIAIAKSDESGLMHFEIRKGHISQNPYYYLPN